MDEIVTNEFYNIISTESPNTERFRELARAHPELLHSKVDSEYNGTALHAAAKWDTYHSRDGLLTEILLNEFKVDPGIDVDGSLPLYWALNQISGHRSLKTALVILKNPRFDYYKVVGKRGSAISVASREYSRTGVLEAMAKIEDDRKIKHWIAGYRMLNKIDFV